MKPFTLVLGSLFLFLSLNVTAADAYGDLDKKDQTFYKNDYGDGMNQRERIDSTVIQINKIYAELANLKAENARMKEEIEKLKAAKK